MLIYKAWYYTGCPKNNPNANSSLNLKPYKYYASSMHFHKK